MTLRERLHAEIDRLPESELKKLAQRLALEGETAPPRTLGVGNWRGNIEIADDFDELPEDLMKAFAGEGHEPAA